MGGQKCGSVGGVLDIAINWPSNRSARLGSPGLEVGLSYLLSLILRPRLLAKSNPLSPYLDQARTPICTSAGTSSRPTHLPRPTHPSPPRCPAPP